MATGYITIPKLLFGATYSNVSATAKLLYGFLADRSSLSKRNGWKTPSGEVFIYFPISEVCETLGCGHDKARRLLRELADAGLIRRIRQGQGKPDKIIVNIAFQPQENKRSRPRKSRNQEYAESAANNTDIIIPESINPDQPLSCNRQVLETIIRENINYDLLISQLGQSFASTIVSVMVDAICNTNPTIKIAGVERERDEIYRRLMHINEMHVQYAYDRTQSMTQNIRSPRAYILARLYLAEEEMDIYYGAKVAADERRERGVMP